MKFAVYAIAKNEAKHVKRFLDSVRDADAVYLLDTGSEDDTVALAQAGGAIVETRKFDPWRFDVARNASLGMVPEDFDLVIALDLDEIMPEGWRAAVEKVWRPCVDQVRYEFAWNHKPDGTPDICYWAQKMHSRHNWQWVKPVHEVLKFTSAIPMVSVDCPILVHHWADDSKPRSSYLPLLELAVSEEPDDDRSAHYLAREYFFHGRYSSALMEFQRHLSLPTSRWGAERAASRRYMAAIEGQRGNPEAQIAHLREATRESPDTR
jgi:glycosyltransferase involved in cell wall biosynthesis